MNKFAPFLASVLVALALGSPGPTNAQPLLHFENFDAFDSVEGPGTVHPDLDIDAIFGPAVVIETGKPAAYGAPNAPNFRPNNCLEDANGLRVDINTSGGTAKGFADVGNKTSFTPQDFDFNYLGDVTVNYFSLVMFDFGDLNRDSNGVPWTHHRVTLRALDEHGGKVDEYVLDYNSDGLKNPMESDYGNLLKRSGDPCTDQTRGLDAKVPNSNSETIDGPGYLEMKVEGAGITKVELRIQDNGNDPNIAFDSIHFIREARIDVDPGQFPNAVNSCANQGPGGTPGNAVRVAILGSFVPLLDVTQIDQSSIRFAGARPAQSGSPRNPRPTCDIQDTTGLYGTIPGSPFIGIPDGEPDLICTFRSQNMDMASLVGGQGKLTANLLNGTPISGIDSVALFGPCVP
jgi:hypothetical protein